MRFDWLAFCRREHIEFVTSGANTAKGNISIKCPLCGAADESQHMGLKLDPRDPQWGCFRNPRHAGRHPAYLIVKLLNIRYDSAVALVDSGAAPLDEYDAAIESLQDVPEQRQVGVPEKPPLTMPKEFKRLLPGAFKAERFFHYLSAIRGFGDDCYGAAGYGDLHYALTGEQAYRVIFPVTTEYGSLAGWTGRSIAHNAPIRYLAMEGMGKDIVYAYPPHMRRGRRALLIVEGPMDALKLNVYGSEVHAIATMGTSFTDGQLAAIVGLRHSYMKMIVISDRTALAEGLMLAEQLSTYAHQEIRAAQLPSAYKDPGEMPKGAIKSFCSELTK